MKVGECYGRLTIFREADLKQRGMRFYRMFECLCSCGNTGTYTLEYLRCGSTRSCGCLSKDIQSKRLISHGMSYTREYHSWSHMLQRCLNKKDKHHQKYYSDISVCKRWMKFDNFYKDMGERPIGKSLDRINPYGNYEKENCRWATPQEQNLNTRKKNRPITGPIGGMCV